MPQLDIGVLVHPERLAALRRAHGLLTAVPAPVEGLLRLATRAVVAPVGLLTLVDDERMHIVGCHGLPSHLAHVRDEPVTGSFCQYVVSEDAPLVVPDARDHPLFGELGAVREWGVTAYLGHPVHDREGQPLGAVCVTDRVARQWSSDEIAAVGECAHLVEALLGAELVKEELATDAAENDAVLETALEAFVGIDMDGRINRWNRAAERTFGWMKQEAVGQLVDELIIPERFRATHRAGLGRLARGGPPRLVGQRLHLWAIHRDGREFPVEMSLNVTDGANGRHAHAFLYDISERVGAERQLARERQFLAALLDNLDAGVVACDERGQMILFNKAIREITGSEAKGSTSEQWLEEYNAHQPPDRKGASEQLPLVRAFRGEHVRDAEIVIHLPGRPRRLFTVNAQPIRDADGARLGAVAALHEVTERRRGQRFVECELAVTRILEHAPSIEEVGPDLIGTIARTLGWAHGELWRLDKVGNVLRNVAYWTDPAHPMTDFLPGPMPAGIGLSGRALESGQPIWVTDIATEPDHMQREALAEQGMHVGLAVPVRDGGGVVGTLAFFGDAAEPPDESLIALVSGIAAHIGQYHERRRAEELQRLLARTKDEFIALVGHELRTPLTSISAYTELLLGGDETEEDREQFLGVIARNAETLRAIIDDLLDLAGLESGYVTMNKRQVDLAATVRAVTDAASTAAREKELELTVDLPADEVPVVGDPPRLRQVVDHLVGNAIKYTPQGGRVEVRLTTDVAGVHLCVSDTGIGIPEDERERLFQRFFRGSNIRNNGMPGTGLGLAISRTVVERHGGTITMSDHGDIPGTTFKIHLPLLKEGPPFNAS